MNHLSKICVFLACVSLVSMGAQTFYKQSPETYLWLNALDNFICVFFLADWFNKLFKSESKKQFLKWGWIDFLLSIPATPGAWAAYPHALRFARCSRSLKYIVDFFSKHHQTNKFADCCIFCIAFIFFSAIAVFNCEKHVEGANIKNMSDSIWWTMATITTIGYGDRFPVSDIGRVVGGIVMIGGVGLYASFTGFVVSKFITDDRIDKILKENIEIKELLLSLKKVEETD